MVVWTTFIVLFDVAYMFLKKLNIQIVSSVVEYVKNGFETILVVIKQREQPNYSLIGRLL